ncbi:MAG: hypothetical protein EU548_00155 [Promethearchaeota archaeon]|nr:MAG: hypothetical protein EU548_00155 [Candidatus Lokiarchaeota archaeon]
MIELRNGINSYKFEDKRILITPELNKIKVDKEFEFPPKNIDQLSKKLIRRFKKRGILVDSGINDTNPVYDERKIIKKITFKDIDKKIIDQIFSDFLRNCSITPVITIDCGRESTSRLLELINEKYNENSINPIVRVYIKEEVDETFELLNEYLNGKESIELNNLFLIFNYKIINNEIIEKFRDKINPMEMYIYINDIGENINKVKDMRDKFNLPILLEIENGINDLELELVKKSQIMINDDSINRLLNAFRLKAYMTNEVLREKVFMPYCGACKNRLFIEGDGRIFACNTGYRADDCLGDLKEMDIKDYLNSQRFIDLRGRVVKNSKGYQKTSSLMNFYSGCIYNNYANKFKFMDRLLRKLIE